MLCSEGNNNVSGCSGLAQAWHVMGSHLLLLMVARVVYNLKVHVMCYLTVNSGCVEVGCKKLESLL